MDSVLRPFQDYFCSYETEKSVGGRKQENPEKNLRTHPQAELGLSHMWRERGSNPDQTQRRDDRVIQKQPSEPLGHRGRQLLLLSTPIFYFHLMQGRRRRPAMAGPLFWPKMVSVGPQFSFIRK